MLGDTVERALKTVGITPERVERWLGHPCNCEERKQRLNQIDAWARRVARGRLHSAAGYLEKIIGEP